MAYLNTQDSPERIAFDLLQMIDGHYAVGYSAEMDADGYKSAILDAYVECLEAVKGDRKPKGTANAEAPE